jgi:hypothetical protein
LGQPGAVRPVHPRRFAFWTTGWCWPSFCGRPGSGPPLFSQGGLRAVGDVRLFSSSSAILPGSPPSPRLWGSPLGAGSSCTAPGQPGDLQCVPAAILLRRSPPMP